jgi:hypothetical protein
MAILQFSKTYGPHDLEAACELAQRFYACSYSSIKNILQNKDKNLR